VSRTDVPTQRGSGIGAPLAVAAVLALVAGSVDAICFARVFDVFPANQSGNAVLLGIGLGRASSVESWRPAVSIVGFGFGVAAGIVLGRRLRRPARAELLLGLEVVLLVPIAIVMLDTAHPRDDLGDFVAALLLFLTSTAMGLQTEVIGRVATTEVATTYQTGAIAHIAEAAADRVRPDPATRTSGAPIIGVLATVLVAYVAGAALGAALGDWRASLLVPLAMLGALLTFVSVAAARSRVV
jgi:uncharacterized membrane protein YoaK (UPF0700 family)